MCTLCGVKCKKMGDAVIHVGFKHGYINDVLEREGYKTLPCIVHSTGYTAAKQRRLVELKAEREFLDQSGGATVGELWSKYLS